MGSESGGGFRLRPGCGVQQRHCQCLHRAGRYGYCQATAEAAGKALDIPAESVLVASTGVIGQQLPMPVLEEGVKNLVPLLLGTREAAALAAEAIMTTDTVRKEAAVEIEISGKKVTIGGMCKGSGMIHPNMCTMLSFVTTDVQIDKALLKEALKESVQDSYNMISVDGDTSTNDTVLLLANGMADNPVIKEKDQDYELFKEALDYINKTLAQKIAGDGEGATALFEVKVVGTLDKEQAVTLSKSVIHLKSDKSCYLRSRCQLGQDPVCNGIFRGTV